MGHLSLSVLALPLGDLGLFQLSWCTFGGGAPAWNLASCGGRERGAMGPSSHENAAGPYVFVVAS